MEIKQEQIEFEKPSNKDSASARGKDEKDVLPAKLHHAHHSLSAQKEKIKHIQEALKLPQKKIKAKLNLDLKSLNKINK